MTFSNVESHFGDVLSIAILCAQLTRHLLAIVKVLVCLRNTNSGMATSQSVFSATARSYHGDVVRDVVRPVSTRWRYIMQISMAGGN